MEGLNDKVVGIIGTGCTGVQCAPLVAESAKQLFVFQRTPAAINVRGNRPTDPEWAASLTPGWQRDRMENFSIYVGGGDAETDLVNDGWTAIYRLRSLSGGVLNELDDFQKMEEIRSRVDSVVKDVDVAQSLKPWYRALCKRPVFHDEYLDAFNRTNVTLVDTDGMGVDQITPNGAVVDGVEYPLDCLIFASGFAVGAAFRSRLGYDVTGVGGRTLSEKFSTGISTLYGMQTEGFPNFFLVAANQVGVSSNQTHVLDVQSRHISAIVRETLARGAKTVEVEEAAEDAWVRTVIDSSRANIEFLASCTPSYYNNEGNPNIEGMRRNGPYAPGIVDFDRIVQAWREEGSFSGLVFKA
jgi:cyclohexanone monooxygenase